MATRAWTVDRAAICERNGRIDRCGRSTIIALGMQEPDNAQAELFGGPLNAGDRLGPLDLDGDPEIDRQLEAAKELLK